MTECMRRPRLYTDRMWLEGWRSVVAGLARRPCSTPSRETARFEVGMWARVAGRRPLTARETGRVDALLDAWGC